MSDNLDELKAAAKRAVDEKLMTDLSPVKRAMGIFYSISPEEISYVEMLNEVLNGFATYCNVINQEGRKLNGTDDFMSQNVYRGYRLKVMRSILSELAALDGIMLDQVIDIDFLSTNND